MVEKLLTVKNRAGIHARPAAIISQTANRFESEILLIRDDQEVIGEMERYSYAGSQKRLFEQLKNAVEDIDTEKAEEILREWEKTWHN